MSAKPRPTAIQIDKSRQVLVIPWDDGHSSEYGWYGLREACPCAGCRGGHENMGVAPDPNVFNLEPVRDHRVDSVELVGNYALLIVWVDGHRTGIYTWDYLRGLCPCEACRVDRAQDP